MPIEKNTFIDSLSFSLKKSRGAMTKSANKNLPPQVLSETRKKQVSKNVWQGLREKTWDRLLKKPQEQEKLFEVKSALVVRRNEKKFFK